MRAHAPVLRHRTVGPEPRGRLAQSIKCPEAEPRAVVITPSSVHSNSPFVGTILLVDDHDAFRVATVELLSSFGFTVESARSAEAALSLFNPDTHDVVVTDNTMPGLSGAEMAHIIKLRSPATPVLMYTANPPEAKYSLDLVIQKPAPVLALKQGLEKLLADRGSYGVNPLLL